MLCARFGGIDGHILVCRSHRALNHRDSVAVARCGANPHAHASVVFLSEWNVHQQRRLTGQCEMPHLPRNTDHFERRPSRPGPRWISDPLADGILTRPHFLRYLLADDHHPWRTHAVAIREIAPLKKRNAKRPEIIRRDAIDVDA